MSDTPRTDAMIYAVLEEMDMVHADDCRTLERELAESARKLEEAERKRTADHKRWEEHEAQWNSDAQEHVDLHNEHVAQIAELQQQLVEAERSMGEGWTQLLEDRKQLQQQLAETQSLFQTSATGLKAAARSDQHAECVRLLLQHAEQFADPGSKACIRDAAEWLDRHKP